MKVTNFDAAHSTPPSTSTISTTDPTVTNDAANGYTTGSTWLNTTTAAVYILVDSTPGAAIWVSTTAVSAFSFSTTDGVTTVNPTVELTFVGATLTDLGGGDAEVTLTPVDITHEVVMQTGTSSPPVPIWNSAGDDWVYSS
jgi:hypothetical protein